MADLSESLKEFCNRVAQSAVTESGSQMTRLLRLAGLMGPLGGTLSDNEKPSSPAGERRSDQVGIWERKTDNGRTYFGRRPDTARDWNYWANVGRIEPKGSKRRIVLMGESVARGYLYDPEFTVAMALEKILINQMGDEKVEVIDLARTNLGLEVRGLAKSALMLEPDAVIFSGNNWHMTSQTKPSDFVHIAAACREQGVLGLKRFAEAQLEDSVRLLVSDLSSLYAANGVHLAWIVPEFNLGDWRDSINSAPYLLDDANRPWILHYQNARHALGMGKLPEAVESAKLMVALDGGVNVTGLYILAECHERLGDLEASRHYLELARDAVIWDLPSSVSPRCYTVAQETLREQIRQHKGYVVDLPKIFKEYLGGDIPDRRMFLDYCHLTSEGIQVTVAAAASCLLRALGGVDIPWRPLIDDRILPSRQVEAETAFLAAVHNAHWWQSQDVILHHSLRSTQLAPEIAELMSLYLEVQTRKAPMLMCQAAEEITELGSSSNAVYRPTSLIQHYLLRYNNQQLDRLLLDALVTAMKAVGIETAPQLLQLRRDEHALTHCSTNLLDYYYNSSARQPQEVMWVMPKHDLYVRQKENHYYIAYWLESRFFFVSEADCPVRLCLTCRLPGQAGPEEAVSLEINGQHIGTMVIGREWETWEISVAGDNVLDDLNEITIRWPTPEFPSAQALAAVADDMVNGIYPELFCAFGEIHSFTVTANPRT